MANNNSGGPGILGLAAGVATGGLAVAKLGGFAQISWLLVFSPFLVWLGFVFIVLFLVLLGAGIAIALSKD